MPGPDPAPPDPVDDATRAELVELVRLGRKYKWATGEARRFLEDHGVNLARSDFYSEVPTLAEIEQSFEYAAPPGAAGTPAVFDHPDIFSEERLRAYAASLVPHAAGFDPSGLERDGLFSWTKGQLVGTDAMSLYAMIRRHTPRRVIEIGSGQSTFVAAAALRDAGQGQLYCIDPEPRRDITGLHDVRFARARVQEIDPAEIVAMLGPGDILFYDGEHSLKTGNSAVYFYHFVLPYLAPGVIVHVHDVRLPYPRNRKALTEARLYWAEQYVLLAYLHDTRRHRVLFGSEFCQRRFPDLSAALMHGRAAGGGVSLWFEILDDGRTRHRPALPVPATARLSGPA